VSVTLHLGRLELMLATLGSAALLAAMAAAAFGTLVSFWSGWRRDPILARTGRRALYAAAGAVVIAAGALEAAFLMHDFDILFVAEHSDRATPVGLLAAGFYAGQEGSLLYWALVLSVLGSAATAAACSAHQLQAYAAGVLGAILSFFLLILVFVASPFATVGFPIADGLGLNPILRDGGMLIHPPFLLAGYATFAIPFSFAMAALLAGRVDAAWIAHTRRVALLAWGLQGTGLALGMWWAYHVIGWGGYWGWDAVENVALLPWLATTAFIHSAQVQERRGQLRAWNFGLVILAFLLSIFGTFIVRSGVIESVHSFAVSPIGPYFFAFLAGCILLSGAALAVRSSSLRADQPLPAAVSREGAYLLNNLLLLGVVAAVFWGTILPLVSGLLTGHQRFVGPAYYQRTAGPLLLVLFGLLAVGPLVPWRRAGTAWLRSLALPTAAAALAAVASLVAGADAVQATAVAVLAAAGATATRELGRGWRQAARRSSHVTGVFAFAARHRRRYGAHLAHLGIVLVAIGIAGSQLWQRTEQVRLEPGAAASVAGHRIEYLGSTQRELSDRIELVAAIRVDGSPLETGRVVYTSLGGQALTQVGIQSSPMEDVYVVLAAGDPGGAASLRVFVNPLVSWIWAGAALLIAGVLAGNLGGFGRLPEPASQPARPGRRTAVAPSRGLVAPGENS
jgi:cytochrome c-type biogenesis protein CcmF